MDDDQLDQSQDAEGTSEKPSTTGSNLDLDAIVAGLDSKLSPRFQSLLTTVDKKLKSLDTRFSSQLSELKTAGLSEAEQEQLKERQLEADYQRLQIENELFRLREQHPKAADLILRMRDPELATLADQVAAVEAFLNGGTAAPAESAEPTPKAPEVDRNNPARPPANPSIQEAIASGDMDSLTDDALDEILKLGAKGVMRQGR